MDWLPLPAPAAYSPRAAALASFSSRISLSSRAFIRAVMGTLVKSRLDQYLITPVSGSMAPGAPMPTEATSSSAVPAASAAPRAAAAIWSATASAPLGVGRLTLPRMVPSLSTTAAATLVPPKSIPKYFIACPSCVKRIHIIMQDGPPHKRENGAQVTTVPRAVLGSRGDTATGCRFRVRRCTSSVTQPLSSRKE